MALLKRNDQVLSFNSVQDALVAGSAIFVLPNAVMLAMARQR
jgi:hypothetical protein